MTMELNLKERVDSLEGKLQEHIRQDVVHAHPRNGEVEKVLQYLGLDISPNQGYVMVKEPAKDNSKEQTADKVL